MLLGNESFAAVTARSVVRIPSEMMLHTEPEVIAERLTQISPLPLTQVFLFIEYPVSFNVALFTAVCARCQCLGLLVGNCDGASRTYFTWMATPDPRVPCAVMASPVTAKVLDSLSHNTTVSYTMTSDGIDPGWDAIQHGTLLMAIAAALFLALALLAAFKGIVFCLGTNGRVLRLADIPRPQMYIVCMHFMSAITDLITFVNIAAWNFRGLSYGSQNILSETSNPLNTSATIAMALLLREASQCGAQTFGQRLSRLAVYVLALGLLVGSLAVYIGEFVTFRRSGGDLLTVGMVAINYLFASVYFTCFGYATARRLVRMKGTLSEGEIRRRRRFTLRLVRSGFFGFATLLTMLGIVGITAIDGAFATFWTLYGLNAICSAVTRMLEISAFAPAGQKYVIARVMGSRFVNSIMPIQPATSPPLPQSTR